MTAAFAIQTRARVAKAAVIEAQTNLAYATITAPFDGVISHKLADVGDLASPGKALLEVEDTKSLRLEADVPEGIVGRVEMGAKFSVRIEALPNELGADPPCPLFDLSLYSLFTVLERF